MGDGLQSMLKCKQVSVSGLKIEEMQACGGKVVWEILSAILHINIYFRDYTNWVVGEYHLPC